jgi:hypothetical protein
MCDGSDGTDETGGKMVSAMGTGLMANWEVEGKELVALYAIELRTLIRRLVRHRVLPDKESADFVERMSHHPGRMIRRLHYWCTRRRS